MGEWGKVWHAKRMYYAETIGTSYIKTWSINRGHVCIWWSLLFTLPTSFMCLCLINMNIKVQVCQLQHEKGMVQFSLFQALNVSDRWFGTLQWSHNCRENGHKVVTAVHKLDLVLILVTQWGNKASWPVHNNSPSSKIRTRNHVHLHIITIQHKSDSNFCEHATSNVLM